MGACVDEEERMLVVMELMDHGTLFHAIAEGRVSWYYRHASSSSLFFEST
jgi:hypothetical protein